MESRDDVKAFLSNHQPMSSSDESDAAVLEELEAARLYCMQDPFEESIPLWLRVFGPGDGAGIYQLVEDVLSAFPCPRLAVEIESALKSPHSSIRYWCAQLSAAFPSPALAPPLTNMLPHSDIDTRYAIVTALMAIGSSEAIRGLEDWLPREAESSIIEAIEDSLSALQ